MEVETGELAEFECQECEQKLCLTCWKKIHNKGARIKHKKVTLQEPPIDQFTPLSKKDSSECLEQTHEFGGSNCSLSEKQELESSPILTHLQVDENFKGNRLSGRTPSFALQKTAADNLNSKGSNNAN